MGLLHESKMGKMKVKDIIEEAKTYGSRFTAWLAFVLSYEVVLNKKGEIVTENVLGDRGGLTFAGIDKRSHPEFNYNSPTAKAVVKIYYNDYWVRSKAESLGFPVGEVVANYAVNMGLSPAVKMLQTAINILPGKGATVVDGLIGPKTVAAAKDENQEKLADLIEDEADDRYRGIVNARPSQRKFLQGWLNRNDDLEKWWMNLK